MVTRETFDDIFDDEADDDIIQGKEWIKTETALKKHGYRDGLDTGQEATLQLGFNQGYSWAVNICLKLGHLRGKLSAHLSWKKLKENASETNSEVNLSEVESLLKQISQYEASLVSMVKQQQVPLDEIMDSTTDGADLCETKFNSRGVSPKNRDRGEATCCSRTPEDQTAFVCDYSGLDQGERIVSGQESALYDKMFTDIHTDANRRFEQFSAKANNLLKGN